MKSQTPLRKYSRWNFLQLHSRPFFLLAERDSSNMSNHSLIRVSLKKRRDVEAFHVIVGSDKEDSTKKFDQCCGEDTCCARGTLLPRILLALAIVSTFAGQFIYGGVYKDYPILSKIFFLPSLVGILISASIMEIWVNAFRYCSHATPKPCCCMQTLDHHLKCAYISSAAVLCLFLGLLSFSLGEFDIDRTIADVLFGLSFAVLMVGAISVSVYLACQIDCDKKRKHINP